MIQSIYGLYIYKTRVKFIKYYYQYNFFQIYVVCSIHIFALPKFWPGETGNGMFTAEHIKHYFKFKGH